MAYRGPDRLGKRHVLHDFTCGEPPLDDWLATHARTAHRAGSATVYVISDTDDGRVVGFHALSAGEVVKAAAPADAARHMPAAVPVIVLGRLAVDVEHQGAGLGDALLKDAMLRAVAAAETIGARALVVHARKERARKWYLRRDFDPSPTDDYHVWLRTSDIRMALT